MKIENFSVELQQSPLYKKYIESLRWTVVNLEGVNIFIRRIPFLGVMAKIQRPEHLPFIPKLISFLKTYRVRRIVLEPTCNTNPEEFRSYIRSLSKFFTIHKDRFLPTKTILIDLTKPENEIFQEFTEAKRRAVRKAVKNNVLIKESRDIKDLIHIKSKSAGMLGEITTYGIDKLWKLVAPNHATILLAYHQCNNETIKQCALVGGVLLLFWNNIAYYWIAGATKKGKKLFAPTLLVWEALKISKKRGCLQFDFVGVFDERIPKQFTSWKGFTKFKEGFGGKQQYYPF